MSTVEAPRRHETRGGVALDPARRHGPARRPQPEPRRHLRVVAPAERVRRRVTPAAGVLLTGALFALLFLVATAHTVLVEGQVNLDGLDASLTVEQARYQELRKQVAEMESPERIVAEAQALGMVSPDDLAYIQPAAPAADEGPAAEAPISGESVSAGSTWSLMKPLLEAPTP